VVVLGARHDASRWASPHVRPAVIGVQPSTTRYAEADNCTPIPQRHYLDVRKSGRLDPPKLLGYLFLRSSRNLLADDLPAIRHAKQDEAADAVQHGEDGLGGFRPLSGRLLELDLFRLASRDERAQLLQVHCASSGRATAIASRRF
jgi:hypothetical protein